MIQKIVDKYMAVKGDIERDFHDEGPNDYEGLVQMVVKRLAMKELDPKRIVMIDHGDYQGTLVFVIGCKDSQPSTYFYSKMSYGTCSQCDSFQAAMSAGNSKYKELMAMALHFVQSLKEMGE